VKNVIIRSGINHITTAPNACISYDVTALVDFRVVCLVCTDEYADFRGVSVDEHRPDCTPDKNFQ